MTESFCASFQGWLKAATLFALDTLNPLDCATNICNTKIGRLLTFNCFRHPISSGRWEGNTPIDMQSAMQVWGNEKIRGGRIMLLDLSPVCKIPGKTICSKTEAHLSRYINVPSPLSRLQSVNYFLGMKINKSIVTNRMTLVTTWP